MAVALRRRHLALCDVGTLCCPHLAFRWYMAAIPLYNASIRPHLEAILTTTTTHMKRRHHERGLLKRHKRVAVQHWGEGSSVRCVAFVFLNVDGYPINVLGEDLMKT